VFVRTTGGFDEYHALPRDASEDFGQSNGEGLGGWCNWSGPTVPMFG
jgi:hypothetical protein